MQHLKIFIELTRLNKPIGFMLLFWPCSWGLNFAFNYGTQNSNYYFYLILFFLGSVLMRSAGCIVNDIVDKDLDQKVERTKTRPLASGEIGIKKAAVYVCILCSMAFVILIQFNFKTILLGLSSMILAFSYPFMKRITYWPQLFLGLTFNWGLIMAWFAMDNQISYEIVCLYLAAIFWTLGYDTIYGVQDMSDDEIIGIKSTAIKFKDNIKIFVFLSYLFSILILTFLFSFKLGVNYFSLFFFFFILSLFFQIFYFKENDPKSCLKAFKLNNLSGFLLFLTISF
ncbi:MAG: 4-hydroxybenzoate polyprenyltransferase [Pelagibacteraceae bacterium TMED216]|nr:MAG: 4-hydroxybenzoate polyprenyltransferase [Pelagibacteraceae bacterium TMED216]|tara:strand:+ start:7594 stop:8445 length:852 start_codon:yes stop_codon:yes gene_type:complete